MKVKCLHGYFIFEETSVGQVSDFVSLFGIPVLPLNGYFTFAGLIDTPDHSIKGTAFLNAVATKNFAGKPWEIFEANGLVYDFNTGLIKPIASIVQTSVLSVAGNKYISPGLILPGTIVTQGKISGYSGFFSRLTQAWQYSEVTFV